MQTGFVAGFAIHDGQAAAEVFEAHGSELAGEGGESDQQALLAPGIEAERIKIAPESVVLLSQQFQLADLFAGIFAQVNRHRPEWVLEAVDAVRLGVFGESETRWCPELAQSTA